LTASGDTVLLVKSAQHVDNCDAARAQAGCEVICPHATRSSLRAPDRREDRRRFIPGHRREHARERLRASLAFPNPCGKIRMIPKSGNRFPAFAKPASAGEGRSEKIMLHE
jgi:hypothetical protein